MNTRYIKSGKTFWTKGMKRGFLNYPLVSKDTPLRYCWVLKEVLVFSWTKCPRSSIPFYLVNYYIKSGTFLGHTVLCPNFILIWANENWIRISGLLSTIQVIHNHYINSVYYQRSLDPIYIVAYFIKWVKTSWTYCTVYINSFLQKNVCLGKT